MKPKITVIVPVYNTEEYLSESLNSICNQTLEEIEVICINDGSTDNSLDILNQFAKNDKRIIVIDGINEGVALARNKGILRATGEFIAFMDPDDKYPSEDVLEKMYDGIKKSGVMICGGSLNQLINGRIITDPSKFEAEYTFKQDGEVFYKDYQYDYGFWRFLYNREFLVNNDILFPDLRRQQDPVFFIKAMSLAGKFYALKMSTYLYRVSHKRIEWNEKKSSDLFQGLQKCLALSKEYNLFELHKKICNRLNAWTFRTALCEAIKYPLVRQKCLSVFDEIDTSVLSEDFYEQLDSCYKAILKYRETGVLISVIVPVYNVEKDLSRCLDSIITQTFDCIEILCVNDGSTDRSADILDKYASIDSRIKIINKENGGLSSARNAAFPFVKGSYVYFVDSDDWIEREALEQCIAHMTGKVDVVVAGAQIDDEGGADAERINDLQKYHNAKMAGEYSIDDSLIDKITVTAWGKLFKYNIIEDTELRFLDGRKYEDNHFTIEYLVHSDNCFFINHNFYHYIQRANSIMNSDFNYEDCLYIFDYLYKRLDKFGLIKKHKKLITNRYSTHLSMSYRRTRSIFRDNVKKLATQLALNYNPEDFDNNYVVYVQNGEYGLVPAFDQDVLIVLRVSYSDIEKSFITIKSLLAQSYKLPIIVLFLNSAHSKTAKILPQDFTKYVGENLFIEYNGETSLEKIIKEAEDQVVLTVESGRVYPKNWLRCVMSAYSDHKEAFSVESFTTINNLDDSVLFEDFALINLDSTGKLIVFKSKRIVVSLTSYPARIHSVALSLETIFKQTKQPHEVLLWLSETQFPDKLKDLPKELLNLISENNLSIRWCKDDLKPHKKYFYTFQEYPDALVITVDDDVFYHEHLIENLFLSYLLHPYAVSAARVHLIPIYKDGRVLPYKAWPQDIDAYVSAPSMQLCATGVGGVLYPTILFSQVKELLDENAIKRTCLYADDLWLKAMELVAGIPVVVSEESKWLHFTPDSQDIGLWHSNLEGGENDAQLLQIQEEIDFRYGKGTFIQKLMDSSVGKNLVGEEVLSDLIKYYRNKLGKKVNEIKRRYAKYLTLRIDIVNKGAGGNSVIEQSIVPSPVSLQRPDWLKNGITMETEAGHMAAVVQCQGDGELVVYLLGKDMRNSEGKRYPVWIDCTYFSVNGETVFDDTRTICHDKGYVYRKPVKDGEIVRLEAAWSECKSPNVLDKCNRLETDLEKARKRYAKYSTLRVDIVNIGAKGNSVIEQSIVPSPVSLKRPDWLKNGITMESEAGHMTGVVQCQGDGELEVCLLGKDMRNAEGKRYPVWIDCTYFSINGETVFDDTRTICHDKGYVYRKPVKDGEIVRLEAAWSECKSSSVLDKCNRLETDLEKKNIAVKQLTLTNREAEDKMKTLQIKTTKLNSELNSLKNGWSFKIGKVITWLPRKIKKIFR